MAPLVAALSPRFRQAYIKRKKTRTHYLVNHKTTQKHVWVHCSSYGEFEGILPLIQHYSSDPTHKILVTFYSPSGFDPLHNHPLIDYCCYLPFDSKRAMQQLIKDIQPDVLLVSQNEYWPHMIRATLDADIPIYYISSYVRESHWWLKKILLPVTKPLRDVNQIFLQDQKSVQLMTEAGFENILLVGNTRVDQVIQNSNDKKNYPLINEFVSDSLVLLCGSTLPKDEQLIFEAFRELTGIKLIIVPHDPSTFDMESIPINDQQDVCQLSRFVPSDCSKSILIVDTLGDLKYLYNYAQLAYVGGGFDAGVHSVLEAAVYDLPIMTGPHIDKFQDAVNLKDLGILHIVHNSAELIDDIKLRKRGLSKDLSSKLAAYLEDQRGATQRMIDLIRF